MIISLGSFSTVLGTFMSNAVNIMVKLEPF